MSYTALYRKFRPTSFDEVKGQDHIVQTLKNQINANRIGHAYLFCGTRGTGKTSTAKVFAKALNCLNLKEGEPCNKCEMCRKINEGLAIDVTELDAASNNGVDKIRDIIDDVKYPPQESKYKVYIMDEVHMLSAGAVNAFLKTLEEPPNNVIFILATTDPQKLPITILSRCQRFDFKRIGNEDIIKRLEIVCKESNIEITKEALNIIAILSEGAMRDALSILERCIQDGENKIDEDKIKDLVGIPKRVFVHDIINAIIDYDVDNALITVNKVLDEGKDISNLLWEIIKYAKDILLYKATQKVELYSDEEISKIKEISEKAEKERLINLVYEFSELGNEIKYSTQKNIIFQAGIIKLCNNISNTNSPELEQRINKIEKYLKTHNVSNNINQYQNVQQTAQTKVTYNNNLKYNDVNKKINTPKESKMKTSSYSNKIEEYWPQIVKDLKQNGKIVLYTNLMNTRAKEINDMTVGIEFPNGLTSFGRTVLEKQENIKELSNLISMASGKPMNIKYITNEGNIKITEEDNLKNLAKESDIPFNVID